MRSAWARREVDCTPARRHILVPVDDCHSVIGPEDDVVLTQVVVADHLLAACKIRAGGCVVEASNETSGARELAVAEDLDCVANLIRPDEHRLEVAQQTVDERRVPVERATNRGADPNNPRERQSAGQRHLCVAHTGDATSKKKSRRRGGTFVHPADRPIRACTRLSRSTGLRPTRAPRPAGSAE